MTYSLQIHTYPGLEKPLEKFLKIYQLLVFFQTNKPKSFVPRLDRTCRFCKLGSSDVTFKTDAHVIPELLGKNQGISDYECDSCNGKFSKLENHLTDYLGLIKSINEVGRKNKVKFKSPRESLIARMTTILDENSVLEIDDLRGQNITLDSSTGTTDISYLKNTYVPYKVFLCFLKMALTVMPESRISQYSMVLDRLQEFETKAHFQRFAVVHEMSVEVTFPKPYAYIFEASAPGLNMPKHVFILHYESTIYQIFIPSDNYETFNSVELAICPPILHSARPIARVHNKIIDLSSTIPVKDELAHIYLNTEPSNFTNLQAYDPETKTFSGEKLDPTTIKKIFIQRSE